MYRSKPEKFSNSWLHPWTVSGLWLALTLGLSVYDLRRKKISKWFDVILFGVPGVLGILLLLLWTATDHKAAANNFNILWALPTHLLVFFIGVKKSARFLNKYFLGVMILTALLLVSWFSLPQQLNIFLIPFVAAVMCRAFVIFRLL